MHLPLLHGSSSGLTGGFHVFSSHLTPGTRVAVGAAAEVLHVGVSWGVIISCRISLILFQPLF